MLVNQFPLKFPLKLSVNVQKFLQMPVIQFFLLLPKPVIEILYAKKEPIHICLSLAQVLSALCTQGQFFLILQEDNQVLWQMFTLLCRTVHSLGCYPLFLHI